DQISPQLDSQVVRLIMSHPYREPFLLVRRASVRRKQLPLLLQHNPVPYLPSFLLTSLELFPTFHHYQYISLYLPDPDTTDGNNNLLFQNLYRHAGSVLQREYTLPSFDLDERKCVHRLASYRARVASQLMRQTFHNGALYPILQSVRVNCDNYITHFYKPSYDVDSSLDVIRVLRYPFSLLETYHRDSDRSDRSFYTNQHYREQVYRRDHSQAVLQDQRYNAR